MFTECVNTNSVINLHISIFNKQYRKNNRKRAYNMYKGMLI